MNAIEQYNAHCGNCCRVTIHSRNVQKMNWLLHIVIALVTFGAWLVIALIIALANATDKGAWVCTNCGTYVPTPPPKPFLPKFETTSQKAVFWLLSGFVIVALFSLYRFDAFSSRPPREGEQIDSYESERSIREAAEHQRRVVESEKEAAEKRKQAAERDAAYERRLAQFRLRREQAEEAVRKFRAEQAVKQAAIDEAVRKFREEQAAKSKE